MYLLLPLAGITLRRGALRCFPELPHGIMLQRPQGNCQVMSPHWPSSLPCFSPHASSSASCNHLPQKQLAGRSLSWRRLLEEVNKAEEDCLSSHNGKPGFRNGLTRGSSDAQPPPLLSGLSPLIWLCPLLSSCPQATSSSHPGQGRREANPLIIQNPGGN